MNEISQVDLFVFKRVQAASDGASIEAYGSAIPGIEEIAVMQPDDQAIYEGLSATSLERPRS